MIAIMAETAEEFALRVWLYKQGEVVSLMIHLGDRLGLYRALDGAGPVTSPQLAAATGYAERWVREWLRGQAAAGLLDSDDGTTFELPADKAKVLSREDESLLFAAGAFSGGAALPAVVDGLADAFRSGRGLTYDQLGSVSAHQTARMLGPWARLALTATIIPALDGVAAKLATGATVVDVGCGAGVAVHAMADAFPNSRFVGIDPSEIAIAQARQRPRDNVTFVHQRGEDIDEAADLVLTFDCLHDMTRPDTVAHAIRRTIKPDGTWLIREIRSSGDWVKDQRNPVLAMMYGFSVVACMSSALSEPDGAGLGTVGLPPPAVEALVTDAGFSRVTMHDFEDPSNLYYEVRR